MKNCLRVGWLAALILICLPAFAQDDTWAVAGKVGSLGAGADLHRVILSGRLNARIGASFYQRGMSFTNSGIRYNGTLRVGAIPIGLDVYPFKNWFRVQGGLIVNFNRLQGTGQYKNGFITLGSHSYTFDTIGELRGTVKLNRIAPFFGVGYGNPIKKDKRWGIFADLGVMYHGEPTLSLRTTHTGSSFLRDDLAAQEQLFTYATHRYTFYPILQVGVSFR